MGNLHWFMTACIFLSIIIPLMEATEGKQYGSKGVPDDRKLTMKISRGSGTGAISVGYIFVSLLAFALFVALMVVIICYKREKGIRSQERNLFYIW